MDQRHFNFLPTHKLWTQWFKQPPWSDGASWSTASISILEKISFLWTHRTSSRNHIRRHLCPTRSQWRSPVLFYHGMFPHREMYMCPQGTIAGYLDLLKALILDASPANRPYLRKQKPVYAYDTYSSKPVQGFAWLQTVEGRQGMWLPGLGPLPSPQGTVSFILSLSSFVLLLLYSGNSCKNSK